MKKLLTLLAFAFVAFTANAQNLSDIAFFSTVKVQTIRDAVGNNGKGKIVFTAPKNCKTNDVTGVYYIKHTDKDNNSLHKPRQIYGLVYHNTGDGKEYLGIEVWGEFYKNESDTQPTAYMDYEIKLDDVSAQYIIDTCTGDTEWKFDPDLPFTVTTNSRVKKITSSKGFKKCPDNNHPHAIDLGLPSGTKWACCNVGANKPEGYGGYYAWGETEERRDEIHNWDSYKHCDGIEETCYDLGENISGTQYDVAHVKWGRKWQMPTSEQIREMQRNCECEDATLYGVKGVRVTGKNGNSIFLPAAGENNDTEKKFVSSDSYVNRPKIVGRGQIGRYWSGTLRPLIDGSIDQGEIALAFPSHAALITHEEVKAQIWSDRNSRCDGLSVRPVWVQ